jgi:hypothetical protein
MRWVAAAVAAALVAGGVLLLRSETMSRHARSASGTRTEVVVEARTKNEEPSSTIEEMTRALVLTCRLEVDAELRSTALAMVDDRAYRFALTPALDASDELQLRGCLEDIRIDHLQVDVISLERSGRRSS